MDETESDITRVVDALLLVARAVALGAMYQQLGGGVLLKELCDIADITVSQAVNG